MTGSEFKTILTSYMKAGGVSYLASSDSTNIYKDITRGLKLFTRYCFTKWEPKQTLTLVAGTHTYSTGLMFYPEACMINGSFLRNPISSDVMPVDRRYLYRNHQTYMTDGQGLPTLWIRNPGRNEIMVYKTPDGAYSNNYLAGFKEHDTVDEDADTVDIEDHISPFAVMFVAKLLQHPHLVGSGVVQEIRVQDAIAAETIEEYKRENFGRFSMATHRGQSSRTAYI